TIKNASTSALPFIAMKNFGSDAAF
ncbi:hypothetical protein D046_1583B, partial [Vibrio parahaemolyticus V-223/04]